jgi:hypothetical protein
MSALAEALVAAQAELPCALGKDADGQIGQRPYRYLTLDKLIEATKPILTKHGLALIQSPIAVSRGEEGYVPMLRTEVWHASGDHFESMMPLYLAGKTMQDFGSAITYARRYAWQSVLGIAAEEDTDGPAATPEEAIPF